MILQSSLRCWLLIGLLVLLFTACQPQVLYVEVTSAGQFVDDQPIATTVPLFDKSVATHTPLIIETIVTQEVTRIVTATVVAEVMVEVTKAPLGSAQRPLQLLFPPTTNANVIALRAQPLADALTEATGRQFEIGILDSEQAIIDLMCAAPQDSIGFLSAEGYVQANGRCGVQAGVTAVASDGYPWQLGMIIVRRDSGIRSVADLEGKTWGVSHLESVPNYRYFTALLADADVVPGELIEMTGDSDAVLAVFNREVDFATATFTPPIMPYEERLWVYGDDAADTARYFGLAPTRSPIGYVLLNGEPEFGGYRLRDARSRIFDIEPQIYNETQILTLSEPIPNDTIAFGADFPLSMAAQIMPLLVEFGGSETCNTSLCSSDFYGWLGLSSISDEAYNPIRFAMSQE